ncbi:hypothetical protein [Petrachloros mirabilis]
MNLFSPRRVCFAEKETEYYRSSRVDRSAINYCFLDGYVESSIGRDFFRGKSVLDVGLARVFIVLGSEIVEERNMVWGLN